MTPSLGGHARSDFNGRENGYNSTRESQKSPRVLNGLSSRVGAGAGAVPYEEESIHLVS